MPTPSVTRVKRIAIVTATMMESVRFFQDAFGFVEIERRAGDEADVALFGLPHATVEETILRLGEQEIGLLAFDPPGRPYPASSSSTDLWFQHFAIIVSDMAAAYARLVATGRFTPITEGGPVTLPPASGGVDAFKFRDEEGHPLELLAFPAKGGPETWASKRDDGLGLGIDHSAIAVADTARSVGFFADCLGLSVSQQTNNEGAEQARMDDVANARVTVTGLAPRTTPPHVELLGYHVGTRRPIDGATQSSDIAATHFVLETEALEPIIEALTAGSVRFISPGIVTRGNGVRMIAFLDPDGHRFIVEEARP